MRRSFFSLFSARWAHQRDTISETGCPWCTAVYRNGKRGRREPTRPWKDVGRKWPSKWPMSYPLREETSGRISTCKFGLRICLAWSSRSRTDARWSSGFDKNPLIIRERLRVQRKREIYLYNSTKSETRSIVDYWSPQNDSEIDIISKGFQKFYCLKSFPEIRIVFKFRAEMARAIVKFCSRKKSAARTRSYCEIPK